MTIKVVTIGRYNMYSLHYSKNLMKTLRLLCGNLILCIMISSVWLKKSIEKSHSITLTSKYNNIIGFIIFLLTSES